MNWVAYSPIFVALVAGGFTILGVWTSQRGAARVVKQTFDSQRLLTHDAALRDYRKQQITPYVEAVKKRFHIWSELHAEIGVGDKKKLLELYAKLTDPYFNSLVVMYLEIPDDAFRSSFQTFIDAEGKVKSTYTSTEVMDKIKQMRLALMQLSTSSERYIFSNL